MWEQSLPKKLERKEYIFLYLSQNKRKNTIFLSKNIKVLSLEFFFYFHENKS